MDKKVVHIVKKIILEQEINFFIKNKKKL